MTIVFTNGCFDILHIGHIKLLRYCQSLGDRLVVGLNSDSSVKRIKGKNRPINNQQIRKEMLELFGVDKVVIFNDDTPLLLIEKIKPAVLVKGIEWKNNIVGQEFVESYGGKVKFYTHKCNCSTTNIISKCQKNLCL